jgi:hypothetical protein
VFVKDEGTGTMYVDGEAVGTATGFSTTADNAPNMFIGARYSNEYHRLMEVDELAIWDTALDGDAIRALYNAGLPTPVTTKTGAYDIYRDNLKAYYKMGDATNPAQDGTSNLLFDQTSPGMGSELITNGDYETGDFTGWTTHAGTQTVEVVTNAAGSNSLHIVSDGTFYNATQNITKPAGTVFKFCFDLEVISGSAKTVIEGISTSHFNSGRYEIFGTSSGSTINLEIKRNSVSEFFVDNVSVREVQNVGTISGAAIQADGGTELLTGFTNGSVYSFDTLVTSGRDITSAIESTGNWGGAASNTVSIVSGQTYKVTFNLTYNSGSDTLRVALVDVANGAATLRSNIYYTNTNGVNVAYLTATATDTSAHLQLGTWHSTDLINFSATDISVKEVTESVPKKTQNLPSAGSAKSLSFDGTDDFVQFALPTVFNDIGSNDFSVSLWFNSDNLSLASPYTRIFEAAYADVTFAQFNIREAGKPSFYVREGGSHYASVVDSALNTGQWYHLVGI